jgi:hypothetical protein
MLKGTAMRKGQLIHKGEHINVYHKQRPKGKPHRANPFVVDDILQFGNVVQAIGSDSNTYSLFLNFWRIERKDSNV